MTNPPKVALDVLATTNQSKDKTVALEIMLRVKIAKLATTIPN